LQLLELQGVGEKCCYLMVRKNRINASIQQQFVKRIRRNKLIHFGHMRSNSLEKDIIVAMGPTPCSSKSCNFLFVGCQPM